MLLPLLVLAIPILDTTLVTIRRTRERRPVTQGGRDHSSHRLVYYGLSERQAVAAAGAPGGAPSGLTGLAYNALNNPRVTALGVLVTFVLLVQFASFLGDLEERSRRADPGEPPSLLRALFSQPRRLVEVLVDFALICTSFLASYLLFVDGNGTDVQRAVFLATLPVLLGVRYVFFVVFGDLPPGLAVRGAARPARDRRGDVPLRTGRAGDRGARRGRSRGFPLEIFLVDALLCTALVARVAARRCDALPTCSRRRARRPREGVLIVGAGRSGRRPARELRETPDTRVVGFLDDNPACSPPPVLGVKVLGGLDELGGAARGRAARTRSS